MPQPTIRTILEASPLFLHVDLGPLAHLLDSCERRAVAARDTLIDPAMSNDHIYVVVNGCLAVELPGSGGDAHALIQVHDCAGELSLIDGRVPSARVVAVDDSEVLAIPHATVWSLIGHCAGIARNLLEIMAGRSRHDRTALAFAQSRSAALEHAASVDALTGLHNRRWMTEHFPPAVSRCAHDGDPLSLIMADVDHFKTFNDRHGHPTGDAVLRQVAQRLAGSLRTQDMMARYGGEEFAILLPQADTRKAVEVAERLRAAMAEVEIIPPGGRDPERITLTCGVASLDAGNTLECLIAAADRALLRGKAAGRNRVEVAARN